MLLKDKTAKITVAILLAAQIFLPHHTSAAYLTGRSVTVRTPITSAVTTHTIRFGVVSETSVASIQLEYCDNTPFIGTMCTVPPGLVVNGAVLASQSGETGFTISPSSTANKLILTRTAAVVAAGPVGYEFNNVTNPSTPNTSTYVRVSTYASADATGPVIDQGGMVFTTAGRFGTAGFVPPHLYFCVGVTVDVDCTTTTGSYVNFGEFSAAASRSVTTQFAAATNDPTGYFIFSLGTTLTSGNNTITPQATPYPSQPGSSQYGINLRDNNNPNSGQNVSGVGVGAPLPNYNTPDVYMFEPGAAIASAATSTDFNRYTTTYIANISNAQPVGVYSTTITYMAVAQF